MARKFGVTVCIHAGGVGLCNMAARHPVHFGLRCHLDVYAWKNGGVR